MYLCGIVKEVDKDYLRGTKPLNLFFSSSSDDEGAFNLDIAVEILLKTGAKEKIRPLDKLIQMWKGLVSVWQVLFLCHSQCRKLQGYGMVMNISCRCPAQKAFSNLQPLIDWCFCVEVLQTGTFEDDMKYMIAFALLCSFQGEKLFPKVMGYPALKLFLLYKRN